MRAALTALLIGVVFALAPSASAGFFPELPGMEMAEKAASGQTPTASKSVSSNATVTDDRVPAPASVQREPAVAGLPDTSALGGLPGGRFLSKMTAAAASKRGAGDGVMALLTVLVVVLFTRFLYRLNDVR
jgi:hypothetical protein